MLKGGFDGFEMAEDTCEWWIELEEKEEITASAVYYSNGARLLDTAKMFRP